MAYNDQNGNTILSTVTPITYKVNSTNLGSNVSVDGYSDNVWTPWGGIIGAQIGLLYDSFKSNSYVNLYARHMGGWAQTNLGTDALDQYDTVALQRTGDWVLNLNGTDKVIGGVGANTAANLYITSNATINTDGSLASINGVSGNQNVSIESGLTGNQFWDRQKNNSGTTYDWAVTGFVPIYTTSQHNDNEQSTGVGLTQNAALDVNNASTISLGAGTDNVTLLNDTRTVTDYWWQSYWLGGGAWHAYTYRENAWTVYWTGSNWNAYNNYKDYTVSISTDVETIYYSEVDNSGNIDYKVYNPGGTITHYNTNPAGFPPLNGPAPTPSGTSPIPSLSQTPTPLDNGGFLPSTAPTSSGASVQFFAPKGSKVAFYTSNIPHYHNEMDDTVTDQVALSSGLTQFTYTGVHPVIFGARDSGSDVLSAALGTIRVITGLSVSESDYNLYLGTNSLGDNTGDLSSNPQRVLAYGFNGSDTITGSGYSDTLVGGDGDDVINGGNGDDYLYGGTNNDNMNGGNGNDFIDGGSGTNILRGDGDGNGIDTILGGANSDQLFGGNNDILLGGLGNDTLTALDGASAHTYLMDDSGTNSYVTDGGDYYYFNSTLATNNVTGNNINTGTMLLESGTTSNTIHTVPVVSNVYVTDASRTNFNLNGLADVIALTGGDVYDTMVDDHYDSFIWTWHTWRSYSTVSSPIANNSNRLDRPDELMTWMSDGVSWWDANPWWGANIGSEPPPGPGYSDAPVNYLLSFTMTGIGSSSYKGYFTAYLNGYTEIFYANSTDNIVDVNELTHIGSILGNYSGSYSFAALSGYLANAGTPITPAVPLDVISNIDLAAADDDGASTTDNVTTHTTNLTLTATIASGVTAGNVAIYDWVDDGNGTLSLANNGVVDPGEVSLISPAALTTPFVSGTTFQADIDLSAGPTGMRTHNIAMTQTLSGQTSDLDFGSPLVIVVKTDATPPSFTALSVSNSSINVTVNEDSTLQLVGSVTPYPQLGANVTALASTPVSIAITAQSPLWSGSIIASDQSGNIRANSSYISVGTTGAEIITGATGDNIIYGFEGNDTITGGSGNDTIFGGTGDDKITGGAGADTITVDVGTDTITDFTTGTDTLTISATATANVYASTLATGGSADYSSGVTNSGTLYINGLTLSDGTAVTGPETITGSAGPDSIVGGTGGDVFNYSSLALLTADTVNGTSGNDTINLTATAASVTLVDGSFTHVSNIDNITTVANTSAIIITLTASTTQFSKIDLSGDTDATGTNVISSTGADGITTIIGSAGIDNITLGASAPATTIDGGASADTLAMATGTTATIGDGTIAVTITGSGTVTTTAALTATTITGGTGVDTITLAGSVSNVATITGGGGHDVLVLGASHSGSVKVNVTTNAASSADSINVTNFLTTLDKLVLTKASVFANLAGTAGDVTLGTDFVSTTTAAMVGTSITTATNAEHVVFDQTTNKLYYNSDGATAGGFTEIATLVGVTTGLAATDFIIA